MQPTPEPGTTLGAGVGTPGGGDGRRHRRGHGQKLEAVGRGNVVDRVVGAAAELLERDGVTRLTVGEICAVAGVSRTTFYAHFTGRDAVLHEVLMRRTAVVVDSAAGVAASCGSFGELCIAIFVHGFRTIRHDPVLSRMLADEGSDVGVGLATASDAFLDLILHFWQPFVERGQDALEIRPDLAPAEVTRWLLRVLLSFLASIDCSETEVRRTLELFVLPALLVTSPFTGEPAADAHRALRAVEEQMAELAVSLEQARRAVRATGTETS